MKPLRENSFLFVLFMLSCTASAQNQSAISWRYVENSYYENMVSPVTCSDTTLVYTQPDTASEIFKILPFKTSLRIIREGEQETGIKYRKWYEIDYGYVKGYIKASGVATHTFSDETRQADYLIITDASAKYNPDGNGFTIYKFDRKKKRCIDTLRIKSVRGDILQEINHTGWKNVNMLFHAKMINAYCGGSTEDVFIIDANGKLSELIATKIVADDGSADEYYSNVWLPIKFYNGKVMLVANGDVEHIFDDYLVKLNTYPFPKELAIPQIELIVFKETQNTSVYDKNGEPMVNADGSYKSKTIKNVTKLYRWNENRLVQIK